MDVCFCPELHFVESPDFARDGGEEGRGVGGEFEEVAGLAAEDDEVLALGGGEEGGGVDGVEEAVEALFVAG